MAGLSGITPTGRLVLVLLVILIQMITSLIFFAGDFIKSNEALISPFNFCLKGQDGGLPCDEQHNHSIIASGATAETTINILKVMIILCLYVPLVLVAFALLSMLFAVYGKDRGMLWCSVICQTASSFLTMVGLAIFVGHYWFYTSLAAMTAWFYFSVCVSAELAFTAHLTSVSGRTWRIN